MSLFFTPFTLNGLTLPNRSVRSAVWEGMAEDTGGVTPRLVDTLTALARNRVGLIVTGHAYVHPLGQAGPRQLGAHNDELIQGLTRLSGAVHEAGGRICLQLAHAGGHAAARLTGRPAAGPSVFEGRFGGACRQMSQEDIATVVSAMADAARRAQAAGFDAVQIHAAHGYLLSQFLSPATNRRRDRYGGILENRARLACEVVRRVRITVGRNFPVLVKLNSEDFRADGFRQEDMLQTAALLAAAGVDAVELSGGLVSNPPETHCARKVHPAVPGEEGYYRGAAAVLKATLDRPLVLVGGIRSLAAAEQLLATGHADLIAFGRPLIAEPGLVRRWQAGDDRPAACLSCNRCYVPLQAGQGVACVVQRGGHARRPL